MASPLGARLLERQRRFWLEDLAPLHGVERVLAYLLLFAAALVSPSSPLLAVVRYRQMAPEWFEAQGLLGALRVGWVHPDVVAVGVALLTVSWLAAAAGLFTRASAIATAILASGIHVITLQANHFTRAWYLPVAALVVLAMTRSTDRFALDHLWLRRPVDPPRADLSSSGLPRRLLLVAAVGFYFASGCSKVRDAGIGWADGVSLGFWLEDKASPLAQSLADRPSVLAIVSTLVLAAELGAPVALLSRRLRIAYLLGWIALHVGIFLGMGIAYFGNVVALALLLTARRRPAGGRSGVVEPRSPRSPSASGWAIALGWVTVAVALVAAPVGIEWWPLTRVDMYSAYVGRGIYGGFWAAEFARADRVPSIAATCVEQGCPRLASERLAAQFRLRVVGGGFRPLELARGIGAPSMKTFRRVVLTPVILDELTVRESLLAPSDDQGPAVAFLRRAREVLRRQLARPERYLRLELVHRHRQGERVIASVKMKIEGEVSAAR